MGTLGLWCPETLSAWLKSKNLAQTQTLFIKMMFTAGLDCGPNNVIINSYRTTTKKHTGENEQIHTLGVNPGAICRLAAKHTVQLTVSLCTCVCVCVCLYAVIHHEWKGSLLGHGDWQSSISQQFSQKQKLEVLPTVSETFHEKSANKTSQPRHSWKQSPFKLILEEWKKLFSELIV